MATYPSFIETPRIGVGTLSASNTARNGTGTLVDVITGASAGTRILEVVVKATDDPADCCVTLFINNTSASTSYIYDELDLGNPAAGSSTVASYRGTLTYANLVLPNASWKLQAAITAAPTSGSVQVFAFGGDL